MHACKFQLIRTVRSMGCALLLLSATLLVSACASYGGNGLKPGESTVAEVEAAMGVPALRWQNPDGSQQLAYPRGPAGFHNFMVTITADGRLRSIENVLDMKHFALIEPGMSEQQVLRILGPAGCGASYFPARDERVWVWRYLENSRVTAHFMVLFDGKTAAVRSTMSMASDQICI